MSSHGKSGEPLILVLMAVYNGEKYLQQQLDSILAQSHQNLRLICRDDGSADASVQLLQRYVCAHPGKVQLLQDDRGNLGAAGSFSALMQWAGAQACGSHTVYYAFADQDDTWHPDKLTLCLQAMRRAENAAQDKPVLVHSDLRVVDADGSEIAASFIHYQGLRAGKTSLAAQLVSNTVTGCTVLMNRALLNKSLPVPDHAVMHDWWISLVASALGRRIFLPATLVDYRQHGSNTLGARRAERFAADVNSLRKIIRRNDTGNRDQIFEAIARQAQSFLLRFDAELRPLQRYLIRRVIALKHAGVWHRRLIYRLITWL